MLIDWFRISTLSNWESAGLDFRYSPHGSRLFPKMLSSFPVSPSLLPPLATALAVDRLPSLASALGLSQLAILFLVLNKGSATLPSILP